MSNTSKLLDGLKKSGLIAVGGLGLVGASYGGYKTGKHIGSKRTEEQLNQIFNNQQIANEYYLRGLQEVNMEKTAQEVAQELLDKIAMGNPFPAIGRWFGEHGSSATKDVKQILKRKVTEAGPTLAQGRREAFSSLAKNPLVVGTAALGTLGAGIVGGRLTKRSSMEKESSDFIDSIRVEAFADELEKISALKNLPKAVQKIVTDLYGKVNSVIKKGYQSSKDGINYGKEIARRMNEYESPKKVVTGAKAIVRFVKRPEVLTGAGGLALGSGATLLAINAAKKKD